MLKANIILPDDSQQTFSEEILEFNWTTRNNEGAGFTASIPILNASLKLCVVNTFTKSIVRGAKVIVYVDGGDLQLTLTVIEVSNLDRKSICEISCTGDFFKASNNVWGTLTIPAAESWAITQENYGLRMVEAHTPPPEAVVSIRKKEDLALGLLWSYPERHNLSVTPFSTVDGKFSGNGVGIFKNTRPGQADPHAPVYRIDADQIIDYQIEAAQPPVTHLRTASLGKLAPTPQIPAISVYKHDPESSIFTNMQAFYIEETQLSAVWTLSEDSDGNILTQTLNWSDGHTTIFPPNQYPEPLKIVGILQNAFVRFFSGSTPRIDIVDRRTLVIIAQVNTGPTEDLAMVTPFGRHIAAKTNLIMSAQGHPLQILWLKTNTDGGGFALTAYKGNYKIIASPDDFTEQYVFIESCKTTCPSDGSLCVAAYYANGTQQLMPYIYINNNDEVDTGVFIYPPAATELPQHSMPMDILVEKLPYTTNPGQVYVLWLSPIGVATVTKLKPSETEVYAQWQYALLETPVAGKWLIAPDTVSPKYFETEMLWTGGARWEIVKPLDQDTAAILQRGNILEWAGTNKFYFIMSRSIYATAIYKGNNYWEVYLQIDANPFASRTTGEPAISHKIADGPTNVIDLPFKVGALNQLDGSSWDEDRGRIELQISKFYVRHGGETNFVLKDIAALNVIATSSYVEVFLDPRDAQPVTVKVTGFSINYDGAITAKLSGLITD